MMLQNMLITSLTPLNSKQEMRGSENHSFPVMFQQKLHHLNNVEGLNKTIKKKQKRVRTAFTTDQLRTLEKTYSRRKYIDKNIRDELAGSLNIDAKSVKIWFQNRRMKDKRKSSESSESIPDEIVHSESFVNQTSVVTTPPVLPKSENSCTGYANQYIPNGHCVKEEGNHNVTESLVQSQTDTALSYQNIRDNHLAYFNQSNCFDNMGSTQYDYTHKDDASGFNNDNNLYHTNYYPFGNNYSDNSNIGINRNPIDTNRCLERAHNAYYNL